MVPASNGKKKRRVAATKRPKLGEEFARHTLVLRKTGATDFITDPDAHSIRWHYERKDRNYSTTIAWRTFEHWSMSDTWTERRDAYWEHIEARVRENMADEILRRRLRDLEKMEKKIEEFDKFLEPLTDKDGEVQLDKDGLPKYALKLPNMDRFVDMYLKLHERVLLLRGEATSREEQLRPIEATDGEKPLNPQLQGSTKSIAPKLSRQDVRSMARQLLKNREPALGGGPEEVIDVSGEDIENGNSNDEHEAVRAEAPGQNDAGGSG